MPIKKTDFSEARDEEFHDSVFPPLPDLAGMLRRGGIFDELNDTLTPEQVTADANTTTALLERYGISFFTKLVSASVEAILELAESHPAGPGKEVLSRLEGAVTALEFAHYSIEGMYQAMEDAETIPPEDEEHDCENCAFKDDCEGYKG